MNHLKKYLGSLFLVAALAAPVTIMAVPAPQDDREHKRVYDKEHKDYHNWDDNENRAWGPFLTENHRESHEYARGRVLRVWQHRAHRPEVDFASIGMLGRQRTNRVAEKSHCYLLTEYGPSEARR